MDWLIQADGLALAPFTQDDMEDWADCWQDEVTQRGFNFIPPKDTAWLQEQRIERFPFWVTAVHLESGARVGSLRLSPDATPDLAIWIYPAHRGKGWGSRAYKLALDYLFAHGHDVIYAGCLQHNTHSRRILQKCGFVRWPAGDVNETSAFDGSQIIMEGYHKALPWGELSAQAD